MNKLLPEGGGAYYAFRVVHETADTVYQTIIIAASEEKARKKLVKKLEEMKLKSKWIEVRENLGVVI